MNEVKYYINGVFLRKRGVAVQFEANARLPATGVRVFATHCYPAGVGLQTIF